MKINTEEILYAITISLHAGICVYLYTNPLPAELASISIWLPKLYSNIGFVWEGDFANQISLAVQFAFVFNFTRRFFEGVILGWPRFSFHDRSTFFRSFQRAICYSIFVFFVIGAWGDLRSNEGGVDSALLVSVTSFIFGSVVNIIDDFVSAVFVCFFSKKEMK